MSKRKSHHGRGLMTVGLLLLSVAMILAGYNIRQERLAGDGAQQTLSMIETPAAVPAIPSQSEATADSEEEVPDYLLHPEMDMPTTLLDGEEYLGVLEIPSLQMTLPVISEWSYPRLKKAPCRYTGSAYTNDMVLAGHNYKTHFGGLKRVSLDDEIRFTDMDGNLFCYRVVDVEVLDGTAVEEMESGNPGLTLFTCTLGGRSRFAVRAELTVPEK